MEPVFDWFTAYSKYILYYCETPQIHNFWKSKQVLKKIGSLKKHAKWKKIIFDQ